MIIKVNYYEKTFEGYFIEELKSRLISGNSMSVSEMDEKWIGADMIALVNNRSLGAIKLNTDIYNFKDLENINNKLTQVAQRLPVDLKFNLFIQFKKPEYMIFKSAKEWWLYNKPYFRFKLYKEQHETLIKIQDVLHNLNIVYASPEAKNSDDVIRNKKYNKVIENSCIVGLNSTRGHEAITYLKNKVHFHSEPKRDTYINIYNYLNTRSRVIIGAKEIKKAHPHLYEKIKLSIEKILENKTEEIEKEQIIEELKEIEREEDAENFSELINEFNEDNKSINEISYYEKIIELSKKIENNKNELVDIFPAWDFQDYRKYNELHFIKSLKIVNDFLNLSSLTLLI